MGGVFFLFFAFFFLFVCSNSIRHSVKTCNQCPNLNIFWKVPFPNRKSVSSCQKKNFRCQKRHILCNIALNFSRQIFIALQNMSTDRRLQNGKQPPNTCRRICDFYYTKRLLVTMATKRRQPEGGLYLLQSGSFWMYMHMCLVVDSSDWRKWEEVTHSVLINNGSCFVPLGCKIYIKNIVAQTVIFIRQETC